MTAKLHVLGAGSILPREGYGAAGYALRPSPLAGVTLLDCGPGSIRALGAAGIELEQVQRVVFTHFHLDHCLDLFALFFARLNPRFAHAPPIELYGPVGLQRLVSEAPRALGRYARDPAATVTEVRVDAAGRGSFEASGLRFDAVRTGHTRESLAWRVTLPDARAFAFTGDTGENPEVAELASEVNLFVAECSFPDEHATPQHLTPSSAARLARAGRVERLLLTHFYPELDPADAARVAARTFEGPIELARDGSVHVI